MQRPQEDSFYCPSFNSYSSPKVAETAAKVTGDYLISLQDGDREQDKDVEGDGDKKDREFECFSFRKAADGVYLDGPVGPVYPIFDRDLLREDEGCDEGRDSALKVEDLMSLEIPMKNLLISEGDPNPSTSSSEVDELETVPPGTYCVWTPNWESVKNSPSPSGCKKSKSTGSSSSSKRWKLLNLLRRSNSDGKSSSFVFLTPSSSRSSNTADKKAEKAENSKEKTTTVSIERNKIAGNPKKKVLPENKKSASAHEVFYVRNRALKEVDKRRSYLPYRKDLVGFCASLNGFPKSFPPF